MSLIVCLEDPYPQRLSTKDDYLSTAGSLIDIVTHAKNQNSLQLVVSNEWTPVSYHEVKMESPRG